MAHVSSRATSFSLTASGSRFAHVTCPGTRQVVSRNSDSESRLVLDHNNKQLGCGIHNRARYPGVHMKKVLGKEDKIIHTFHIHKRSFALQVAGVGPSKNESKESSEGASNSRSTVLLSCYSIERYSTDTMSQWTMVN